MAFQPLSVGDIIMISQTAWKIGRSFTQGKKSAPAEFARVEHEANDLSNVLKLAADTLHADDSILLRADEQTAQAVWAILESAERSLNDLESLVDRYQIIKKRETNGGYIVERSWSDAVLANYRTLKWTTEGGNIKQLQDMLQMHTNTITLTMQALQTKSLARLERIAVPMAENIASIHERVNGDLGKKIDDVHRVIMAVASSTPSLQARDRAVDYTEHQRQLSNGSVSDMPFLLDSPALDASPQTRAGAGLADGRCDSAVASLNSPRPARSRLLLPSPNTDQRRESSNPRDSSNAGTWLLDFDSEVEHPVPAKESAESRASMSVYTNSRSSSIADSPTSTRRGSLVTISEYRALATPPWAGQSSDVRRTSRQDGRTGDGRFDVDEQYSPPGRSTSLERSPPRGTAGRIDLPPPAVKHDHPFSVNAATPRSLLTSDGASQTNAKSPGLKENTSTDPPQPNVPFERSILRNAAILSDTRATLLEYARHNPEISDARYETEMIAICKAARVCVVRKREHREHGGTKLTTSIWVLSDDGAVRCQQKLPEHTDTFPYSSYFEAEKVSIAGFTADSLTLRCHGANWSDPLEREVKTGWVNYVFSSKIDAGAFQSAVFGRTLIGSFRTSKTTVIHDGIKGVFAFEEQFAKMDRLRLFEDDGTTMSGAAGA